MTMNAQATATAAEIFGEPIHSYTRADAFADGYLVDVTDTAREAGFRFPVALTRAA
jgi:type I site-specific restriction endonuclease